MLRSFFGVVAFALTVVAAGPVAAQSQQKWNGPYIGANLGYGWADISGDLTATIPPYGPAGHSIDADGAFGGVQVGFNRRMGNFFVGLEADLQTASMSGSTTTGGPGFTYAASASVDWFGTARVRGGYATDTMLIYATGGLAFGNVDYDATYKGSKGTAHLSSDETRVGFVLGAGAEFALRSNWSLKLEYQYLNFGSQSAEDEYSWKYCNKYYSNTVSTDLDTDIHTVRIGLNYHFQSTPARHDPLKP